MPTAHELLDYYVSSPDALDWSPKHRDDRLRSVRRLKLAIPDGPATDLTIRDARLHVRALRDAESWGARTEKKLLAALRAAYRYAKADRQISENPLDGLTMPRYEADTDHLIYTLDEAGRLVRPHDDVDWRDTLAINIAYDTGRRISAILSLTVADVNWCLDGRARALLRFRPQHDKGRKGAVVPVSVRTSALLTRALRQPEVDETGLLFPAGRLGYQDARPGSRTKEAATKGLRRAEQAHQVAYVKGRGYHALKRLHVCRSWEIASGDPQLVRALPGNKSIEVIGDVYYQLPRARVARHVDQVRRELARVDSNHHRRFQRPVTIAKQLSLF